MSKRGSDEKRRNEGKGGIFSWRIVLFLVSCLVIVLAFYETEPDWDMLQGKRVVVCGASTGIGEQIAYHSASHGAHLLLVARREEVLQKVQRESLKLGASSVNYIVADLSKDGVENTLLQKAKETLGQVDILILNHIKPFYQRWNISAEKSEYLFNQVDAVFKTNTIGYIRISQAFLPLLVQSPIGSLSVVSSIAGRVGMPYTTAYSASKHALHGFFNSLRQDLALSKTKVHITLCTLGSFSTDNAVANTAGKLPTFHHWSSPLTAAKEIVGGALKGSREVWVPLHEVIPGVYGPLLFPAAWDWLMLWYHGQAVEA